MRKFGNITIGGIQQKIFNLVLIILILVMAAYSVVIVHQMNTIGSLVTETNEKQKGSMTEITDRTMDAVVTQSLSSSTQMQAYIANEMFTGTANVVSTLADYTKILLENPERFSAREVQGPDAGADGTASIQLLTEQGAGLSEPAAAEKLALIGNLSDIMLSLYAHAEVDSCYVALPEGMMLLVDDHASSKFDGEGKVRTISIREREWYQGAVETGELYYTDIVSDVFTGQYCIM